MQKIVLYRYARLDGGMTNSPVKPDCDYTVKYRLIADEGKMLTNGTDTTDCTDVDSPDEWQEITKESSPDEIINGYETALAEIEQALGVDV